MSQIIVSAHADADVAAILDHLTQTAGRLVADKYAQAFNAAYDRLIDFPRLGPMRPTLGSDARIWVVAPYVIVYDYAGDRVTILRILHGRRKISGDLIRRR